VWRGGGEEGGPFYTPPGLLTVCTNQKSVCTCTNHNQHSNLIHPSHHSILSFPSCSVHPSLSVYHVDAFLNNHHPLQASLLLLMMFLDPLPMWTSNITCTIKSTILLFDDKCAFTLEDACNAPYSTQQSREVDRQSG
jgi:hypothetical protein